MSETHAATRLLLVRHGESQVTVKQVIGGRRTCSGLSDLGRLQAERLRQRLEATEPHDVDVLLSSDFPRAIETAAIVQPSLGQHVSTRGFERRADFGEHDPGPDIDGMTFGDYVDRFGTPDWTGDPHLDIFPGGETTHAFHVRIAGALERVVREHAGLAVMVSCHGGVIDAAFRHLLGLPMTGGFELQTLNTSITEFASTERRDWRLVRYNDAAHLHGLPEATPRL